MIYTNAMQKFVIHNIAAVNSLSVHPVYQFICCHVYCSGEITLQIVLLIQIYKHNQLV